MTDRRADPLISLIQALMAVLVTCKNEEDPIKMEELECSQDFPIITLWELSVAMETRVLIRSGPKPNACSQPPPQWCFRWNWIMIGRPRYSSLKVRTDPRTPARVPYYKLTKSLWLRWAKKATSKLLCRHTSNLAHCPVQHSARIDILL